MKFLAILLTVLAVVVTAALFGAVAYFGIFVMLVGGIVQVVEACKQVDIPAMDVALGVVRILLTGIASTIGFWVAFFVSAIMWTGVKSFWDSLSPRRLYRGW